jgi:hypothetical protein
MATNAIAYELVSSRTCVLMGYCLGCPLVNQKEVSTMTPQDVEAQRSDQGSRSYGVVPAMGPIPPLFVSVAAHGARKSDRPRRRPARSRSRVGAPARAHGPFTASGLLWRLVHG